MFSVLLRGCHHKKVRFVTVENKFIQIHVVGHTLVILSDCQLLGVLATTGAGGVIGVALAVEQVDCGWTHS